MKTLLHKIRDTAAKSAAAARHEANPVDDDANASSSSSHGSAAQFTQGRRSRSNTHSIRPPKLRVDLANAKPFSPSQAHGESPYRSTPTLAIPSTPRSSSRFRKHRDPAPAEMPSPDPVRMATTPRKEEPSSLRRDSELSFSAASTKAAAQRSDRTDPANTIRPCRSFRENSFAAFNVFKDRSGAAVPVVSNEIAPHESDPALGSGFSTFTMVTNDSHQQVVRLVSHADGVLDGLKDGNSSGGSATSLAHTVGEEETRNRYRQLQGGPSPAPTVPTSRSRARTVLQRLRRPLTAGSTRANNDDAASPPAKTKGFGARKASFVETPTDRSVSSPLHPVAAPGTAAAAASPPVAPSAADMAISHSHCSLDFDRSTGQHSRGRPPAGERRRAVPISQRAASAHAHHAPSAPSNMRMKDDLATRQISRLVSDLLRTGRKPSDPTFGDDIYAKAGLIVSMAERAAEEGSQLPQTPVSAPAPKAPTAATTKYSPSSLIRGIDRLESAVIAYIRKSGHSLSQLDQDAVARPRMASIANGVVSTNAPPLTPTSTKGLSPREAPHFAMPLSPTSPPQPQPQPQPNTPATPSAAELSSLALAARGPAAIRGKDGDKEPAAVSPFESQLSQTSEKDMGMSLTPAPRRRRRPTTAPETGGGLPSPFGTPSRLAREVPVPAFGAAAGTDDRIKRQEGAPRSRVEERRPSITQLDNASAVNRRSFMHQTSHSYSGQVQSEDVDLDLGEGGQVEMLRGTGTPDLSNDGGNRWKENGWGSMESRNLVSDGKDIQHFSRPSTASSATTLSAHPPPQLFTPESFSWRAESRSSSNTPYLRPEASASQTSFVMPSPIPASLMLAAPATVDVPGPGLGIRFGGVSAGGEGEQQHGGYMLKPKSSRKFGGDPSSRRDLVGPTQALHGFGHGFDSAQIYG
ncbi:hypothetical protein OC861_004098 [Tilletia horrida]|nr:hypothetical protein OC861_004098 [Tilletia horrida]